VERHQGKGSGVEGAGMFPGNRNGGIKLSRKRKRDRGKNHGFEERPVGRKKT